MPSRAASERSRGAIAGVPSSPSPHRRAVPSSPSRHHRPVIAVPSSPSRHHRPVIAVPSSPSRHRRPVIAVPSSPSRHHRPVIAVPSSPSRHRRPVIAVPSSRCRYRRGDIAVATSPCRHRSRELTRSWSGSVAVQPSAVGPSRVPRLSCFVGSQCSLRFGTTRCGPALTIGTSRFSRRVPPYRHRQASRFLASRAVLPPPSRLALRRVLLPRHDHRHTSCFLALRCRPRGHPHTRASLHSRYSLLRRARPSSRRRRRHASCFVAPQCFVVVGSRAVPVTS